jgi:hypothetical protein
VERLVAAHGEDVQVQCSAYGTCRLRNCLRNILLVIKRVVAGHGDDVQVQAMCKRRGCIY